jgi:phytoene dehydrogenase-like protein
LVEGLRQAAQAAGVQFAMGTQVASIEHDAEGGMLFEHASLLLTETLRERDASRTQTLRDHRTVRAVRLTDGEVC